MTAGTGFIGDVMRRSLVFENDAILELIALDLGPVEWKDERSTPEDGHGSTAVIENVYRNVHLTGVSHVPRERARVDALRTHRAHGLFSQLLPVVPRLLEQPATR